MEIKFGKEYEVWTVYEQPFKIKTKEGKEIEGVIVWSERVFQGLSDIVIDEVVFHDEELTEEEKEQLKKAVIEEWEKL